MRIDPVWWWVLGIAVVALAVDHLVEHRSGDTPPRVPAAHAEPERPPLDARSVRCDPSARTDAHPFTALPDEPPVGTPWVSELWVADGGSLHLPSGRLVVGSFAVAFGLDGGEPLALGVPGGRYPLTVLFARVEPDDPPHPPYDEIVAVAVTVRPSTPVRWEYDHDASFGTDGGSGELTSPEAVRLGTTHDHSWLDEQHAVFFDSTPYARCVRTEFDGGLDVLTMSSAWGDGHHPGFVGYDARGLIASVVVSAHLLPPFEFGLPNFTLGEDDAPRVVALQ